MLPTGTVTFLFSDIEGSTRRWDQNRAAMLEAVRRHDRLVRAAIEDNGGVVFKTVGDAFCAAFATPEAAVAAAIDVQRSLAGADFSAIDGMRVRIAINTGTADERDGDFFGPTVNRVARLLSLAHGEQVLLSGVVANFVRENPPAGASLHDLGTHALKDLERPERVFQLIAPGLRRDFPPTRNSGSSAQPWLVPSAMRSRYFKGRDALLASLHAHLSTHRRAALSGLGGVGKTQAALEYAVRYRENYPPGVFWVNADSIGGLTNDFVEIARAVNLSSATSNDQELAIRTVLKWLNEAGKWLLILDNVEDRTSIAPFVPNSDTGEVLITSREQVFPEFGIPRGLHVADLEESEAEHVLLARTGRANLADAERASLLQLVRELGALPLALEQAAAYIAEMQLSFESYLAALRKRRLAVLEKSSTLVSRDTVAVTWAANFQAVEAASKEAADVLRISGFIAPDGIPFELFELADSDELSVLELLRPLARYSLVRIDAPARTFGVHRLVQEVLRSHLDPDELRTYGQRALATVAERFPDGEFATWSRCDRLIPHVVSVLEWARTATLAPQVSILPFCQAGRYLTERGRYREAVSLLEGLLDIARLRGQDDVECATAMNNLAVAYLLSGRDADARTLHERALEIRERLLPADHPDIGRSVNNLANVHFLNKRLTLAEPLYARALPIFENALGPDSQFVATTINNLAETFHDTGRYAEAETFHRRALAIRERTLGVDHPHFALSLANLARLHLRDGRYAEAESLYTRALSIRERSLGAHHPDVASSLNDLGATRIRLDETAEVLPLHERALAIYADSVGRDHADVAETLTHIANVHLKRGDVGAAEVFCDQAVETAERIGHGPALARSLRALADVRSAQGRESEARSLVDRAQALEEFAEHVQAEAPANAPRGARDP